MNTHALKKLQSQLAQQQANLDALTLQRRSIDQQITAATKGLQTLRDKVRELEEAAEGLIVTEHAMLRYIERVFGIDLKELEGRILTSRLLEQVSQLGSGKFPIDDGVKAVVKGNKVVTIEAGFDGE